MFALFAFRNQPIAMPRAASELHSPDGPICQGIARSNIQSTGNQRPDRFLTARNAARGRRSEHQHYLERRSASAPSHRILRGRVGGLQGGGMGGPGRGVGGRARGSTVAVVRTRARAAQHKGVRPNASATARSAARGHKCEHQPDGERRSAGAPFPRLLNFSFYLGPPGGGVWESGVESRLHPSRRLAGWGVSGGEGRLPPVIQVRATISCPQNREQSILSFEKLPISIAWTHFFFLYDAPYPRNGCPTDKSVQCERKKGGGMGKYLQAID